MFATGSGGQTFVNRASPVLTTMPGTSSITLGTTAPTLSDTVVLSQGYFETGTITFQLTGPTGCVVDTETVSVTGNGTYSTPTGYTLPTTGTAAGSYSWQAIYSGNANNSSAFATGSGGQTSVARATPTLDSTPNPTSVMISSTPQTLKDTAVLSGSYFGKGSITFTLKNAAGSVVDTETVSVNGNGTSSTPSGYSVSTSTKSVGTYQWNALYTGDVNNGTAANIDDPSDQVLVSALPVIMSPTYISVTMTSTVLGGNVVSTGGGPLTKRGILYSLTSVNPNPVLGGTGVIEVDSASATAGVFTELVNGLAKTTSYSFVAFASNSAGTTYTPVTVFFTAPATSITGPSTAQVNQPATFTFFASSPTLAAQSQRFVFNVNWGDNTSSVITNFSGTSFAHTYARAGVYTISAYAVDARSTRLPTSTWTVTVGSAAPLGLAATGGSNSQSKVAGPTMALSSLLADEKQSQAPAGNSASTSSKSAASSSSPDVASSFVTYSSPVPAAAKAVATVSTSTSTASGLAQVLDKIFASLTEEW